ncbi:MAG: lipid-A-disaccharide synthase [Bryobacteraceae bacterium]
MALKILVSAGEASGDLYLSRLVETLQIRHCEAEFFGCAGPRMQTAGVRAVVDAKSLAVVGLVEVIAHLPRIHGEFRKLLASADKHKPDLAILCDSPDFNLRVARQLKKRGIPVVYLVAPQVWAWRENRVRAFPGLIDVLLCIFPFEQSWFRLRGVNATYIGHPLTRIVKPRGGVELPADFVAILPGSRPGEVGRHLPALLETVAILRSRNPNLDFVLALPEGFTARSEPNFSERIRAASIQVIEGATWDVLAQAKVALAASGTVTMEAAMLGTPMVTFYRVNAVSWFLGSRLVRVPHVTMVNLVAGGDVLPEAGSSRVVTEWIQGQMTPENLAGEVDRLLHDEPARNAMRAELVKLTDRLRGEQDPMEKAANEIEKLLDKKLSRRDFENVSS